MTDQNFEDALNEAIALAGGSVTPESCPAVIPLEQLRRMTATMHMLVPAYDIILNRYGFKGGGALALTHSPAFTCQVKRLGGDKYAILVPLGMPARVRVLARVLLRYWGRETNIQFVRSLRDNFPVTDDYVPRLLRPLFLSQPDLDGYWEALHELDQMAAADPNLDPRSEGDLYELVHLALVMLTAHELTHIVHGHWALVERSQRENLGLSEQEIRRGLELDADMGGAAIAMQILHLHVDWANERGEDVVLRRGWLRLSYVSALLFGIFDAQRKYLHSYDLGAYNHPVVRYEIFSRAVLDSLNAPAEMREDLKFVLDDGRSRCIRAFNNLNLDVMQGVFGEFPKQMEFGALQSLVYNAGEILLIMQMIEKELKLVDQVRHLLPIYRAAQGENDQNASLASSTSTDESRE